MCFVDCCEYEGDFVVFDYVDDVWMVVFYFVYDFYWYVGCFDCGSCVFGCDDWVVEVV